jgi:hypothetical protein
LLKEVGGAGACLKLRIRTTCFLQHKKYSTSQTNDKTRYAFREPSIEGAKIGDYPNDRLQELDREIKTENEADFILNSLKNADIAIENKQEDNKLIKLKK